MVYKRLSNHMVKADAMWMPKLRLFTNLKLSLEQSSWLAKVEQILLQCYAPCRLKNNNWGWIWLHDKSFEFEGSCPLTEATNFQNVKIFGFYISLPFQRCIACLAISLIFSHGFTENYVQTKRNTFPKAP